MKAFFYLLCLLNLGFLFWQFHLGKFNPIESEPVTESSILLLNEYERAQRGSVISGVIDRQLSQFQQQEIDRRLDTLIGNVWQMEPLPTPMVAKHKTSGIARVTEEKPVIKKSQDNEKPTEIDKPTIPIVQLKCYDIGPFADEAIAKQWLAKSGLISNQVFQIEEATPRDYQVYYPAAKSTEQTRINKMMLVAKGLKDIWLISNGENKGGFSLGVFKEKQRAKVFKSQLAERDIQAEILQRKRITKQWFVSVMLDKLMLKRLESEGTKGISCSAH